MYSRIAGTGSCLPEKVVTNFDLEKTMDTTDEWIRSRTGIERRHIVRTQRLCWHLQAGPTTTLVGRGGRPGGRTLTG